MATKEELQSDVLHYKVKQGCPSDDELEDLSLRIGYSWEALARPLKFSKAEINAFRNQNDGYVERAFGMLETWKKKWGSEATYRVLHDALCHQYVRREDLAEQFCVHHFGVKDRPIFNVLKQLECDARKDTSNTDLLVELKKIASDKGFMISDNQEGANCMFHALSEQLDVVKGIQISHQELRHKVVNYLKKNPKLPDGTELFNFVDGYSSWNSYLSNMAVDGTWGDHVTLHGVANCFGTHIHVISCLWHNDDLIINPERDVTSSNRLVLGRMHKLHYVSLIPRTLSEPKSQVTATDPPEHTVSLLEMEDLPGKMESWDDIKLPIDILLLTVKDCELLGCLSYLNQGFRKRHCKDLGIVFFGDVGEDKPKLRIAVMMSEMGSGGTGGSTIAVVNAVRVFRPKAVFSVGFCGGLNSNKVRLGDVIISVKLITYAPSQDTENGIDELGVKVPLKRLLAKLMLNAAQGWKAPLKDPKDLKVKIRRGTFLSGPKVIDDNERRKTLMKRFSAEAVVIEMEGEGLHAAAHDLDIDWIVIRGVSDYADGTRSETNSWRPFSSLMAASLTAHILSDPTVFQGWLHYGITREQNMPEGRGEGSVDQYPNKTKIHGGTVTSEGTHWDLKVAAARLTFPPDAVSVPTSIVVHKWNCSACLPPLQEHEAIVSNVIEISTIRGQALKFNGDVTLFLSHSAPNLRGYELVIKRLIGRESDTWEDLDGTENIRHPQDIKDDYPSSKDNPDFFFPCARVYITKCSTYAVVCRLKPSPSYNITPNGGTFSHPDYPDVTVTIPKKAVNRKTQFSLTLKVQEVPSKENKGQDVLLGPILRIDCSQAAEILQPVTIKLPVHARGGPKEITDPLSYLVRVFFLKSEDANEKWIDITCDLEHPASFDGTFVSFQVDRFSRYTFIAKRGRKRNRRDGDFRRLPSPNQEPPMLAAFFAYFYPFDRPCPQNILYLICCPAHFRESVVNELERKGITPSEETSMITMIPGEDKAFVFLSGGISALKKKLMKHFHLRFERNVSFRKQLLVRLCSEGGLAEVQFYSCPSKKKWLSTLYLQTANVHCTASEIPTSHQQPGLKRKKVDREDSEVEDEIEMTAKKGVKRKKVEKGDAELKGKVETKSKEWKRKRKGEYKQTAGASTSASFQDSVCHDQGLTLKEDKAGNAEVNGKILRKRKFQVKDGCPTLNELEGLSRKIVKDWESLGHQLGYDDDALAAFDMDNAKSVSKKAYTLLKKWKQRDAAEATYEVLYEALCHEHVNRRDLGEKLCCY